jgi:hypothetical protein
MNPEFPRPPLRHPWGETDPPCSETWPCYLNEQLLELAKEKGIPMIHTMDRHPEPHEPNPLTPEQAKHIERFFDPGPIIKHPPGSLGS